MVLHEGQIEKLHVEAGQRAAVAAFFALYSGAVAVERAVGDARRIVATRPVGPAVDVGMVFLEERIGELQRCIARAQRPTERALIRRTYRCISYERALADDEAVRVVRPQVHGTAGAQTGVAFEAAAADVDGAADVVFGLRAGAVVVHGTASGK